MDSRVRLSAALAPLLVLGASQAAAAPQILSVIASAEPVILQCDRGECSAEFTVYCIEQRRTSPEPGTAYYIHDPHSLVVDGTGPDGTKVEFAGAELLSITTERGHSAVRMSLPESVLRQFGLASVSVSVGESASLVPVPIPDDPRPNTAADIALATGPMRSAAAEIVDHGGERIHAVQATARVINALPRGGRASDAQRGQIWESVGPAPDASGYGIVREGFERCYSSTRAGMMSLRQCLSSLHDSLIGKLNSEYWRSIEVGS